MNDFALIVPVLDGEFAATLREDGTLAIEMSDATLWCERTGDAPEAPVAEPTAEPTAEPDVYKRQGEDGLPQPHRAGRPRAGKRAGHFEPKKLNQADF